ncbi:caspase domain-containing protein [Streptomyces sp. NPDC005262]|uniref:caspase family protein n=1 Tax=Streptomyces sp. NPDC005262 TaxID=3364710 RepID=UPI0036A3CA52
MLDPNNSRLIIAGSHTYTNLDDLPSVRNNISRLAAAFTNPLTVGLNPDVCRVLEQPKDPQEILDAVYDAAAECTDTLIFYYAGHGLTSLSEGGLSLALPTTVAPRPHTAVRFDDVRLGMLSARKAPRKIVILDCCFSGRAMVGSMGDSSELAAKSEIEGTYILAAAAETKTALAPMGEECTAFTGEMLHILESGIPNGPKLLTIDLIYASLHARLTSKSRPLPQQRNRNEGAKIVLARNAGYSTGADREGRIIGYMTSAVKADIEPHVVRVEMNSSALSYAKRIRSAQLLAYYDSGLKVEVCAALEGFLKSSDIRGMERVSAILAIATVDASRTDWAQETLISITDDSGALPYTREKACAALHSIGAEWHSLQGYKSILADKSIELDRRVSTAEHMVECHPKETVTAVQFMWFASRSADLNPRERIDVLRKLCELHPVSISAASEEIDRINQTLQSES